jgi:hypothetical protein
LEVGRGRLRDGLAGEVVHHEQALLGEQEQPLVVKGDWDRLWEMLPDKKRVGRDWIPPMPLTLTVWWETPLLAKTERLDAHIRYAAEHEALEEVDAYLRGLRPEEWFYGK